MFCICTGSCVLMVSSIPRIGVGNANLILTVLFLVCLLFGGFLLNTTAMSASLSWLQHISMFKFAFEIIMTNELTGITLQFNPPGLPSVPVVGDVFLQSLGLHFQNIGRDFFLLALLSTFLLVVACLLLSFQSRGLVCKTREFVHVFNCRRVCLTRRHMYEKVS